MLQSKTMCTFVVGCFWATFILFCLSGTRLKVTNTHDPHTLNTRYKNRPEFIADVKRDRNQQKRPASTTFPTHAGRTPMPISNQLFQDTLKDHFVNFNFV